MAVIGLLIIAGALFLFFGRNENAPTNEIEVAPVETGNDQKEQNNMMRITSPLFQHNGNMPIEATCDGKEINPPLAIAGVPKEAKTLALILRDPDAPSGTFYHWVLWNIDPKTTVIDKNSVPRGAVQGLASTNNNFYIGPCPPSGTHRYFFDLYALDVKLDLPKATTGPQLRAAMEGHILETAELMAKYR